LCYCFFFQAEDGIRDYKVTGVQTCALPISRDGLALAVRVGGEEHPLRGFRGLLDFGEGLGLLLDGHVLGREAVLDVHAELALRRSEERRVGKEWRSRGAA